MTTREGIACSLDEYISDTREHERIGPALPSFLGVEDAPSGGRDALFPAWRTFFDVYRRNREHSHVHRCCDGYCHVGLIPGLLRPC